MPVNLIHGGAALVQFLLVAALRERLVTVYEPGPFALALGGTVFLGCLSWRLGRHRRTVGLGLVALAAGALLPSGWLRALLG